MRFQVFMLACALIVVFLGGCAQAQIDSLPTNSVDAPMESEIPPATVNAPMESETTATDAATQVLPDGLPTPLINRLPKPTPTSLPPALADAIERKLVILTTADLTERLHISIDDVQLVQIEVVTWPDASLGCPQPNMVYAQGLTPGYRIVLEASGENYDYHSDRDGYFLLCDPDNPSIIQRTPEWRLPPTD